MQKITYFKFQAKVKLYEKCTIFFNENILPSEYPPIPKRNKGIEKIDQDTQSISGHPDQLNIERQTINRLQ